MRDKTVIMLNKIKQALITNEYLTAQEIAKLCHFSTQSAYRAIKLLRLQGIGIIPTVKGYVLSEYAKKKDDVHFIRRCFGRRTSDLLAIKTAESDIKKRWKAVNDKVNIKGALTFLKTDLVSPDQAKNNVKYLLSSVNGKGS